LEVVGVGPNPRLFLTVEGLRRIEEADVVVSSESMLREIDGMRVEFEVDLSGKEVLTWDGSVRDVLDEAAELGRRTVVLARGDPLYMGVGKLACIFHDAEVVPGVSSLQALLARECMGFHEVEAHVNLHSEEDVDEVVRNVKDGRVTAVLYGKVEPAAVVEALEREGLTDVGVLAGERLWYPDEVVARDLDALSRMSHFSVSVFFP